jgi:asparagine synthase (glutamine-hydrolysing)
VDLADLVHALVEPIGDGAPINVYLIRRAAREAGVEVVLSGMGAGGLSGDYRKHFGALQAGHD